MDRTDSTYLCPRDELSRTGAAARRDPKRPWLVVDVRHLTILLCLLSYLAQGIAACMHQHSGTSLGFATARLSSSAEPASSERANAPDGDSANPVDGGAICSLCQFTLIDGGIPPSAAVGIPAVVALAFLLPLFEISRFVPAPASHSWQGRAPPHLQ